jgi:hypothetical protein
MELLIKLTGATTIILHLSRKKELKDRLKTRSPGGLIMLSAFSFEVVKILSGLPA